jgi:hypothetical protein
MPLIPISSARIRTMLGFVSAAATGLALRVVRNSVASNRFTAEFLSDSSRRSVIDALG